MRWLTSVLCVLSFICQASPAGELERPDPIVIEGRGDLGWHFYYDAQKIEEEEDIDEETSVPPPSSPSDSKAEMPEAFSTAWFAANYEKIEKAAIDNPSKQNIRALIVTERMMLDKSEVFARNKVRIAQTDPLLQDNNRIPISGVGKSAMYKFKKQNINQALDLIGEKMGIIYFYDGSCVFCHHMVRFIGLLARDYGWTARVVARNIPLGNIEGLHPDVKIVKDELHSKNLKIKVWPTTMLYNPKKNEGYIVSQGVMTYSALQKTIINVALEKNILGDDWFYKIFPQEKGLIAPSQFAHLPKDIANDPIALINYSLDLIENPAGTKEYFLESEDNYDEE